MMTSRATPRPRFERYAAVVIGAPGTTLSATKAVGMLFHAQKERTEVRGDRMT